MWVATLTPGFVVALGPLRLRYVQWDGGAATFEVEGLRFIAPADRPDDGGRLLYWTTDRAHSITLVDGSEVTAKVRRAKRLTRLFLDAPPHVRIRRAGVPGEDS